MECTGGSFAPQEREAIWTSG